MSCYHPLATVCETEITVQTKKLLAENISQTNDLLDIASPEQEVETQYMNEL